MSIYLHDIPFDLFLKDAQSLGFLENDPKINVRELQEYFYRIIQKGIYKSENVLPGTVMGNICLECGKPSFIHFDNNCNVLKISKTREI